MISDDNVSQEPIQAAETTIAMTPSGRKSMIAQLFEKESEVEAETLEVQTSMISTESEQTIKFDATTPISVGAMTPASRKTLVAQLTKEDVEAQKSAQSSAKGQLILKCPLVSSNLPKNQEFFFLATRKRSNKKKYRHFIRLIEGFYFDSLTVLF